MKVQPETKHELMNDRPTSHNEVKRHWFAVIKASRKKERRFNRRLHAYIYLRRRAMRDCQTRPPPIRQFNVKSTRWSCHHCLLSDISVIIIKFLGCFRLREIIKLSFLRPLGLWLSDRLKGEAETVFSRDFKRCCEVKKFKCI